jgi:cytochrome bd ubiquinol oxidase subunit II
VATLWFCFAAIVIVGYVVLDGFDLGAGVVALVVAKTEREKSQVLKTIAPVWDGNEVWLITAGGVLFCAFPTLYAASFSGFYLPLMIVLWLLILRGISIELRDHMEGLLWKPFWSTVFGGASATLALILGVALGNVVRGVPIDASGDFFLPLWTDLRAGTSTGIIDWYTLLVGIASLLALAIHGGLWVILKTTGGLQARTRTFNSKCWPGSIIVTLLVSLASFSIQPILLKQFQGHPWGIVFPAMAAAGLIGVRTNSARGKDGQAFLASSVYLIGMLTSAAFGVFPNVLPSNTRPDFSLTIFNAATSPYGLMAALGWFLPGMALTITYTVLVYRHFAGKVA